MGRSICPYVLFLKLLEKFWSTLALELYAERFWTNLILLHTAQL
jgi:hypothetical protein